MKGEEKNYLFPMPDNHIKGTPYAYQEKSFHDRHRKAIQS